MADLRLRIREARDDDALLALLNEPAFQRYATHLEPFAGVDEMRLWLSGLGVDRFDLVCDRDREFAGYAALFVLSDRQSHIGWFFLGVREEFGRQGVGAALLGRLLEVADLFAGLRRVQLTVYADNAPAIRLYEKFGFEIEGRHRDFLRRDDGSVDGLTMARVTGAEAAARNAARAEQLLRA
jgi:putative acetyltransferase